MVAQIIDFALFEEGVVFVAVAACGGSHVTAARAEVIFFLVEVLDGSRGESGLGVRGKAGVGDCVGEGTSATEVHDVAEGHESRGNEEEAASVSKAQNQQDMPELTK